MSASKARKIVELYREIEKRDAEIALLRANLELQQKSYEREIVLEVAAERKRWREWVEEAVSYVGCETWSPSLKEEGKRLLGLKA